MPMKNRATRSENKEQLNKILNAASSLQDLMYNYTGTDHDQHWKNLDELWAYFKFDLTEIENEEDDEQKAKEEEERKAKKRK